MSSPSSVIEPTSTSKASGGFRRRLLAISRFWLLVTLVTFGLGLVAMLRVGRIDPTRVTAGEPAAILLQALLVALAGTVLGVTLDQVVGRIGELGRWLSGRFRSEWAPPPAAILESTRDDVTRSFLLLAGVWAAFKWLIVPLSIPRTGLPPIPGNSTIGVPLIGASAGPMLLPVSIGLGCEALLGLVRLTVGESRRWWVARALLRLLWIGFLVVLITGRNLLIGDPLEWASRIGPSPLSPAWLEAAPRAMATGWPLVQLLLAGSLVWQLLMLSREMSRIWRGR